MLASMNPCTEIRGEEKVRLRPGDQHDQHGEDGDDVDGEDVEDEDGEDGEDEDGEGDDESEGLGHSPVRLLLNAWFVP